MRMIMIAVLALVVLGGGGAGAYFYFQKPAEAAATEGDEVADNHGKKDEKHAKAKKKGGHGADAIEFVEMDPLILPIVNSEGLSQTVSLVIALEVSDKESVDLVEKMTPKLKDAYIQDMYGMLSQHANLKGGVIQVGDIKSRLNKISAEVLGEDIVHDVLLQVVQQRPI